MRSPQQAALFGFVGGCTFIVAVLMVSDMHTLLQQAPCHNTGTVIPKDSCECRRERHPSSRTSSGKQKQSDFPSVCLAMVGFQGVQTLERTLRSYERSGLLRLADRVVVSYQGLEGRSPQVECWVEQLAVKYGLVLITLPNERPAKSTMFRRLAMACSGAEYLSFLEEDFMVDESVKPQRVKEALQDAAAVLSAGAAQLVYLRDPFKSGKPDYDKEATTFIREHGDNDGVSTPLTAQWAYNSTDPDVVLAHFDASVLQRCSVDTLQPLYCGNTSRGRYAYTNNPVLYELKFWMNEFGPWTYDRSMAHLEMDIQASDAWSKHGYAVAFGGGFFTHVRTERTHDFTGRPPPCSQQPYRPPHKGEPLPSAVVHHMRSNARWWFLLVLAAVLSGGVYVAWRRRKTLKEREEEPLLTGY